MNHNAFSTRVAHPDDLQAVLDVQRQAFNRVAIELDIDPSRMPPLTEQLSDLRALHANGTTFFVACDDDGVVIGSARAARRAGTVEIGRLVVADPWTRRGVATALMDTLEAHFPDATSFELFTGAEAHAPLALYRRRGYRETRRERGAVELVWLTKYPVSHD